jgi:Xaa-Pro aminopeptidase
VTRARVARLRAELGPLGVATFLVTNPVNIGYLTGFASSNAALLVSGERVALCTDGRYLDAARAVEGLEVVETARDIAPFLGERLRDLADPPVAFEAGHVSYAAYEALAAADVELRPAMGVVERLREVKEDGELAVIRAAARPVAAALTRLTEERLVGRTEAEVAWWLERALREEGADALAFPPIVASGPNAARPHHHPGDRVIAAGETVVVDLGAGVAGYLSDCTRTFATGTLAGELRRAYDLCREAQAEALAAVRPGAAARDIDGIARRKIADAGHEVLHGLGHGVGLDVHEGPRLSDTSDAVLEAGNVVTVEPGVYLSGVGGVRIEDLVIVGDDGPEVLTPFTKELVTLG